MTRPPCVAHRPYALQPVSIRIKFDSATQTDSSIFLLLLCPLWLWFFSMTIGVLALQGDFEAHRRRLEELGAEVVLVKKPEELDEIDGLVIPGGESGTFLKLLGEKGFERLKQFVRLKPTFGTCAGAILLATEVENPKQAGLGAIDIRIRRNAYGRQLDSSIREGMLGNSPLEMVFIRAPKIERVGPGVEVIATEGTDPVAVRQGRVMAATFHPELAPDPRIHRAFLDLVGQDARGNES